MIYNYEDKIKSLEDLEELKTKVFDARNEIFEGFHLKDMTYDECYYFRNLENDELFAENKKRKKKPVKINTMKKKKESSDVKDMANYVDDLFTNFG